MVEQLAPEGPRDDLLALDEGGGLEGRDDRVGRRGGGDGVAGRRRMDAVEEEELVLLRRRAQDAGRNGEAGLPSRW